ATVAELRREGTVVLAVDTSTSMTAADLAPTRIEAARAAAKAFVAQAPGSIRIGVVSFGGGAVVLQAPTTVREDVVAAVDRLVPQGGTSIGQGIFAALQSITGGTLRLTEEQLGGDLDEVDIGYYGSSVLVMFTDGEDTSRLDPLRLAELAGTAGVRIHTVGLGDPQGTTVTVDGFTVATRLDEQLLRDVSETTGGSYFAAPDEAALAAVYGGIDLQWTAEPARTELTALVAVLGLVLLVAGAGTGIVRTGRVI
ncbi:MAG: VWA domain-containing protein, partial [Candidatus Phosphoribacter sp.]